MLTWETLTFAGGVELAFLRKGAVFSWGYIPMDVCGKSLFKLWPPDSSLAAPLSSFSQLGMTVGSVAPTPCILLLSSHGFRPMSSWPLPNTYASLQNAIQGRFSI